MAGRVTQFVVESLEANNPKGRVSQVAAEVLRIAAGTARATQVVVEILRTSSFTGSIYSSTLTFTITAALSTTPFNSFVASVSFTATGACTTAATAVCLPSVALTAAAALSADPAGSTYFVPVSLSAAAGFDLTPNNVVSVAVTFALTAVMDQRGGGDVEEAVTFTATPALATTYDATIGCTITFAATAGLTVASPDATLVPALNLTASPALDAATVGDFLHSVMLTAAGSLSAAAGVDVAVALTFSATPDLVLLPGTGWFNDVTLSETGGFGLAYTHAMNGALSLTATGALSASVGLIWARPAANTLAFAQALTKQGVFGRTVTTTLSFVQTLTKTKVSTQFVENVLGFTQFAGQVWPASGANTVTFSQVVSCQKIANRQVSHSLAFVAGVSRVMTYQRSVTSTLVFGTTHVVPATLNGSFYQLPNVAYVLVPPTCFVLLQSSRRSIVLPCPRFDDTQAPTGQVRVKRAQTGDTRTYVQRGQMQALKYDFWLSRAKSLELSQFVLDFGSETMRLTNHHAETWQGILLTNPLDLVAKQHYGPQRELVAATLEFAGIKIMG